MKLADLLKGVEVTELKAPPELEIADVCYDSRRAAADTLFVAVRGFESDGHRYIYAAAAKGAVCAVCEEPPECDIPYVIVPDSRLALALILSLIHIFHAAAAEEAGILAHDALLERHGEGDYLECRAGLVGVRDGLVAPLLLLGEGVELVLSLIHI